MNHGLPEMFKPDLKRQRNHRSNCQHPLDQHPLDHLDFPGGSGSKEPACSAGDPGSIPGSGRSPGEGNSNPLQYSCLENPMDRGAWQATLHGVAKSQAQLRDFTFFLSLLLSFFHWIIEKA